MVRIFLLVGACSQQQPRQTTNETEADPHRQDNTTGVQHPQAQTSHNPLVPTRPEPHSTSIRARPGPKKLSGGMEVFGTHGKSSQVLLQGPNRAHLGRTDSQFRPQCARRPNRDARQSTGYN
jgi:hypothetical protein